AETPAVPEVGTTISLHMIGDTLPLSENNMPKMTPGYAKNTIRRALRAVDREPNAAEVDRLWQYFGSACAYCARPLNRAKREWHIDHLIPGQGNQISNRVLSCASCNGDEKRENDWLPFLREKTRDKIAFLRRRDRILSWCSVSAPSPKKRPDRSLQQEIE